MGTHSSFAGVGPADRAGTSRQAKISGVAKKAQRPTLLRGLDWWQDKLLIIGLFHIAEEGTKRRIVAHREKVSADAGLSLKTNGAPLLFRMNGINDSARSSSSRRRGHILHSEARRQLNRL